MKETKRRIWIITLFPEIFAPFLESGVAGQTFSGTRGQGFEVNLVQLRDYCEKDYKGVDAPPYGGGQGMVMRADILKSGLINGVVIPGGYGDDFKKLLHVVYTGPRGRVWDNDYCKQFAFDHWGKSASRDLVFICGRYEGIDERFLDGYVDETLSIGDFVLTGGELAVMTVLDSAIRFTPGALGNEGSAEYDSFNDLLLEYPQYTRPREFEGKEPPSILLSGNHAKIDEFRHQEKLRVTRDHRPDLYTKYSEQENE